MRNKLLKILSLNSSFHLSSLNSIQMITGYKDKR